MGGGWRFVHSCRTGEHRISECRACPSFRSRKKDLPLFLPAGSLRLAQSEQASHSDPAHRRIPAEAEAPAGGCDLRLND